MDAAEEAVLEQQKRSALGRLVAFLKSLIPVDPMQLLFLAGTIFLLIVARIPWQPEHLVASSDRLFSPQVYDFYEIYAFLSLGNLAILAGALFAFYACFWPMRDTLRKLFWYVLLPCALGFSLILWKYFDVVVGTSSLLDPQSRLRELLPWIRLNFWNFPTSVYITVLGLVLVTAYWLRIAIVGASLPLALARKETTDPDGLDDWRRVRLVLFVLIGLLYFVSEFPYLLSVRVWGMPQPHAGFILKDYLFELTKQILNTALLLGLVLYILGTRGRVAARDSMKTAGRSAIAAGFAAPLAIIVIFPLLQFVYDRGHWATYDFGRFHPPIFSNYFDLRLLGAPWIVFLFFGAFAEEIVFRGVLLRHFMRRYGLQRGILLTGLAWAAIHFRSDSYNGESVGGVLNGLLMRVLFCLLMNYVFAWMFLRWKSVIPSGIAHTVWNLAVFAKVDISSSPVQYARFALWVALAYVLYRIWPITEDGNVTAPDAPEPQPAAGT